MYAYNVFLSNSLSIFLLPISPLSSHLYTHGLVYLSALIENLFLQEVVINIENSCSLYYNQ